MALAQRLERCLAEAKQPIEELVGEVTESTPDHKKRHCPFNQGCPRCHWIKRGEKLCQKYGRVREELIPLTGEFWPQPRQPSRGGHWALGCAVCALLNEAYTSGMNIPYGSAKHERRHRIFDTKWTRYEIRTIDLIHLREHARSDQHLRALRYLLRRGSNSADAEQTSNDSEGSGVTTCSRLGTGCPPPQHVGGSSPGLPPSPCSACNEPDLDYLLAATTMSDVLNTCLFF